MTPKIFGTKGEDNGFYHGNTPLVHILILRYAFEEKHRNISLVPTVITVSSCQAAKYVDHNFLNEGELLVCS